MLLNVMVTVSTANSMQGLALATPDGSAVSTGNSLQSSAMAELEESTSPNTNRSITEPDGSTVSTASSMQGSVNDHVLNSAGMWSHKGWRDLFLVKVACYHWLCLPSVWGGPAA